MVISTSSPTTVESAVPAHAEVVAIDPDLRMVFHVEKVRAPRMRVPLGLPGPQATRVDLNLDGAGARVRLVEGEGSVDVLEVAAHVGDHHVAHAESRGRVSRFEEPGRHGILVVPGLRVCKRQRPAMHRILTQRRRERRATNVDARRSPHYGSPSCGAQ